MAGYNGSGPRGKGPMTGRGRGYCMIPADEGAFYGQWLSRCFVGQQCRKNRNNARFGPDERPGLAKGR